MQEVQFEIDPSVVPPYQGGTLIRPMADTGAVDGTTSENKYYIDNFTLEQNAAVLRGLVENSRSYRKGSWTFLHKRLS